MDKVLMIGADVHDESVLTKFGVDQGPTGTRAFRNHRKGRQSMVGFFQEWAERAGVGRIVFAYEASGSGYLLWDELTAAGMEAHVLAPSRIERSPVQRRTKTDEKDAQRLLEVVRGAVLGGNRMPDVWVPDVQTRDDREVVRARLDVTEKATAVKAQIQTLLKRSGVEKPEGLGVSWGGAQRRWLWALAEEDSPLAWGARVVLNSLRRQLEGLEAEIASLDGALKTVAASPRYAAPMERLTALKGVKLLTALVFLTEMGDVGRFRNRRQIGAYLGLAPSSHESGEAQDRKGHITRQGSARVRKALCQATWARVRYDTLTRRRYERLVRKNPNKKKIALVACMRQLGILLWHKAVESAPPQAG